jgi:pimeloyl-ACP methyl ester carboxylesterase
VKPSLVLLPGLMCDAAAWAPQVQALSPGWQCHVPHYGSLSSLQAMAEQVLATAPAEQFALAGHSMGGRVAFEVMRLAAHRVTHLALLDTATHPLAPGEAGKAERAGRMTLLAQARSEGMRAMAQAWARPMLHPSRVDTPLFDEVVGMIERSNTEVFAAQINALLNRPDALPGLARVRVPTLVLCGREDHWSPVSRHEVMHQAIAGSTLVVVEQCGHMSTMEQPDAVVRAMRAWLKA